jgi:hypothetical protein
MNRMLAGVVVRRGVLKALAAWCLLSPYGPHARGPCEGWDVASRKQGLRRR